MSKLYTAEDLANAYKQALLDVDEFIDKNVKTSISEYCKVASPEVYEISAFIHRKLGKRGNAVKFDEPVILNKYVSDCHEAQIYTEYGDGGTNFYRCAHCSEPCNSVRNV